MDILFLLWRLAEISFSFIIHLIRLVVRLGIRTLLDRKPKLNRLLGDFIAELLESLGATFIKIGQILSSRPDLLPSEIIASLTRLQDRVAPFNTRRIPGLIQEAFGRSINEIFESFDYKPISSASVAHVHWARLKDGTEVAVKIRRPGLLRKVKNDLLIIKSFAKTLDLFPIMRLIPLTGLVAEFSKSIELQLDFTIEANNNQLFHKNFAEVKNIIFPKLINELCTDSVLVMEFLNGLMKVSEVDFTPMQRKTSAIASVRALYKMIFIDGFIHADLHPGNIYFREGGECVILDLGMVASLNGSDLKDFVDFFLGMVINNGKNCARVVYDTATYRAKDCDRQKFEAGIVQLINEHSSKTAREFEVTSFAVQLFNIQRQFGIRGSTNFTMAILSLAVFEGIVKQLQADLDFQGEARSFIFHALQKSAC
ncbi:hypothetical protein WA1_00810 [Scytonema hofmannii PCC 7110]|uniref:Protein kinase domain-containing protein n=1 Tax=Scytonema hofmannii PCC 7110 TaxID=128403 RepID=A0A139XGB6_9CYAN|nr:AarF/UbiB family protein [Scytonema hofmannii]KYC43737.1 hypothetical protein WA1_00810 [Scytonema hofmannii PCC 7110]